MLFPSGKDRLGEPCSIRDFNEWSKLPLVLIRGNEFIFHPNIIDYYQNILDSQEKINLAYFAAYYECLKVKYYWIGYN